MTIATAKQLLFVLHGLLDISLERIVWSHGVMSLMLLFDNDIFPFKNKSFVFLGNEIGSCGAVEQCLFD